MTYILSWAAGDYATMGNMEVKIVSLNVWHGGRLFEPMVDFLRAQNADILLLQEVLKADDHTLEPRYRTLAELQKHLGYEYADFAPSFTWLQDVGKVIYGNAVLSKFPLKSYEPVFFNEPYREDVADTPESYKTLPRNLQHVEAHTPGGPVHVFNLQGVWDLDGDSASERRQNMSRIIIEQTKGLPHVVVAGDTNAKPTNKVMIAIEEHLQSVFKNELTSSFNLRHKDLEKHPGYATAVVDLMYVSHDVEVIAHDCPDVNVSDHLPLTATLKIG